MTSAMATDRGIAFSEGFKASNRALPRPNRILFSCAAFFASWNVLGLSVHSLSLYLSFLCVLLDANFVRGVNARLGQLRFSWGRLLVVGVLIILVLGGPKGIPQGAKTLGFVFIAFYFREGLRHFGERTFVWGFLAMISFACLQSIETNFLGSDWIDPKRLVVHVTSWLTVGIEGSAGHSFGDNYLLAGFSRVGGGAFEPGHLAAISFVALVAFRPFSVGWFAAFTGQLLSFSKVSFIFLPVYVLLLFAGRYRSWRFLSALVVAFFGSYLLVAHRLAALSMSVGSLPEASVSILGRMLGGVMFWNLPGWQILVGAGQQPSCDLLGPGLFDALNVSPFEQTCPLGHLSFPGSMASELGVLGLAIFVGAVHLTLRRIARYRSWDKVRQARVHRSLILLPGLIVGMQAMHYLTSYPIFAFAFARVWLAVWFTRERS